VTQAQKYILPTLYNIQMIKLAIETKVEITDTRALLELTPPIQIRSFGEILRPQTASSIRGIKSLSQAGQKGTIRLADLQPCGFK